MVTDAGRSRIRNCGYCLTELSGDVRFCEICGCPHHEDCWDEGGGCTVPGCAAGPGSTPPTASAAPGVPAFMPPPPPPPPPAPMPQSLPPHVARTAPMAPVPPATTAGGPIGSALQEAARRDPPSRGRTSTFRKVVASVLIVIVAGGAAYGSFRVGIRQGREEGVSIGYREGDTAGYSRGKRDGRALGYEEGQQAGYSVGYESGYDEGYSNGYYDGWWGIGGEY